MQMFFLLTQNLKLEHQKMLWETFSLLLKTMLNKSNMLLKLWLHQQVSSEKVRTCKCMRALCLGFFYWKMISKKAIYKHPLSVFLIKYHIVTLIYTYVHGKIFHLGLTWMDFTEGEKTSSLHKGIKGKGRFSTMD